MSIFNFLGKTNRSSFNFYLQLGIIPSSLALNWPSIRWMRRTNFALISCSVIPIVSFFLVSILSTWPWYPSLLPLFLYSTSFPHDFIRLSISQSDNCCPFKTFIPTDRIFCLVFFVFILISMAHINIGLTITLLYILKLYFPYSGICSVRSSCLGSQLLHRLQCLLCNLRE